MLKQLLSATKVIVLALVLSFGLSYAIAAWTPPTLPPPGGNTDAPINIGATPQTKVGGDICTTVSGTTKCVQEIGAASGSGDNLGNHTATTSLNMAGFGINNAGNINATGNAIAKFGPNSTWGAYLDVGGNGKTTTNASVVTTNGNLHLDAKTGAFGTYLNWYSGTSGTHVGNGAAGYGLLTASDVYGGGKWLSATQNRVTGTCAVGSAVRVVNADGTVTCGTFAGTNVYLQPFYADKMCGSNNCASRCTGALSTATTCSAYTGICGGSSGQNCPTATTYNATLAGKIVP